MTLHNATSHVVHMPANRLLLHTHLMILYTCNVLYPLLNDMLMIKEVPNFIPVVRWECPMGGWWTTWLYAMIALTPGRTRERLLNTVSTVNIIESEVVAVPHPVLVLRSEQGEDPVNGRLPVSVVRATFPG